MFVNDNGAGDKRHCRPSFEMRNIHECKCACAPLCELRERDVWHIGTQTLRCMKIHLRELSCTQANVLYHRLFIGCKIYISMMCVLYKYIIIIMIVRHLVVSRYHCVAKPHTFRFSKFNCAQNLCTSCDTCSHTRTRRQPHHIHSNNFHRNVK